MSGPAGPRPPSDGRRPRWSKDAEKYLLPLEQPPVIATRRHWAVLIGPGLKSLPFLALGLWLLLLDRDNRVSTTAGFLVLVGVVVYLGLRIGEWWKRHFIVTNRRVLLTSGLVVRTVALLPLRRITDLTYKETLFGQLLGYGTFRFESAGQQQALSEITYLPRADLLYRKVSDLLFGSNGADSGDDEGNAEPRRRSRLRPGSAGGRRDTQPIQRRPRAPRVAGRRR
ncbi:PH domain-containing protein [Geodermatophilus sabuli]|uniref:PH domain-containing protein n=1 Tax=Geodermatophilus sabuli TaxID=1564158 RepID=A0A285EJQ9_9ACTN|nr:PH domain-containing protein [Geodermatophilus sabuli]MBB3086074.1 putative membrane protein YdbT with pleckstrin-like domain [Geodermatophilus sabuli]SNX98414.1 PH domain-containing protein [Geodermatophilus sabuli]